MTFDESLLARLREREEDLFDEVLARDRTAEKAPFEFGDPLAQLEAWMGRVPALPGVDIRVSPYVSDGQILVVNPEGQTVVIVTAVGSAARLRWATDPEMWRRFGESLRRLTVVRFAEQGLR